MLPGLGGLGWGLLGIVAFSFTLPFTRVAVGGLAVIACAALAVRTRLNREDA